MNEIFETAGAIGSGRGKRWDPPEAGLPMVDALAGDGEMAERIRAMDWSGTPVGPIATWPQSLRTSVEIILSSRYPMFVWWGRQLTNIYNDAYRPFLGKKHPNALGHSAREAWSEIWEQIGPRAEAVLERGEATFDEALLLIMDRFGYPEETYFTFSYSPIRYERGGTGGIFCAVTEDTRRVIGDRRLRLLREVAAMSSQTHSPEQVCMASADCVSPHNRDLPFLLLYLKDSQGQRASLAAQVNAEWEWNAAPAVLELGSSACPWPLEAADEGGIAIVEDLSGRFGNIPTGAWDQAPRKAAVVSLRERGQVSATGYLIVGLNPYLPFDEDYRGFLLVLAGQIAAGIAGARAYQEERKRAEALAEIDRAKTVFFSNISHEFRTPLTLMLGPLEDALAAPLAREQHDRLELAHRNALRLLNLVNALLDFSRIEAGRAQASYEPVDLALLTAELASNFRSACEQAGLELIVDCPSLPEPVYVDRAMWEKIVLNLLSNAFKFTFEGRIEVSLRAAGNAATLSIHDTGVGIPHHELERVFERFHRIEGQRSRSFEGSGIGLSLVQELVKLHQGAILVESEPEQGTTFTVMVPFGRAHLPAGRIGGERDVALAAVRADSFAQEALRWLPDPGRRGLDGAASLGAARPGDEASVLLAEDNADMRSYVRSLLGPNCELETVGDGEAALDAIHRKRPDIVITDVMMPGLDGFGLVRAIRDDPALRGLPVIMLSARAGDESRAEGLEAGADDYLVKPFSAREFTARVTANLKLAQLRERTSKQFETLLNQAPLGVWLVDSKFRLREINPVARAKLTGVPDPIGRDFDEVAHILWPGSYADELVQHFRHTLETGESYEMAEALSWRLNSEASEYYEWRIDRIQLADDGLGVVCYFRDVTAHVSARESLKLLIGELNHRVKNTLATVQSIAAQTLRESATIPEARRALDARLLALASAHDVLTRGYWEGALIRDIVAGSLGAYGAKGEESRISLEGPDILLLPRAALALAMALHELATNAAKYGALSNAAGRVELRWAIVDGNCLSLKWTEKGGPLVNAPQKRGFGTRLIEYGLAQDLGAEIRLDFAPAGLICSINAPLDGIRKSAELRAP